MMEYLIKIKPLGLLSVILFFISCSNPGQKSIEKPNIIIIMADDMGFSDLGCTGSEIITPNIDQLANEGILCTQFYNNARCCPTRASLMTGLYPHQAGIGWMTVRNLGTDSYAGELNSNCVTIAEVLKKNGYNTYMVGKWHLTLDENAKPGGNKSSWPLQRGFDKFFGTILGAGSYYNPVSLTLQNTPVEAPKDFYYTDAISDTAVQIIDQNMSSDTPFFIYVSYTSPHWPLHAPKEAFESCVDKYMIGWDSIRLNRFNRLQERLIIEQDLIMSGRNPQAPEWESLTVEKKKEMALRMAIYAAQIEIMDRGIGKIISQLRKSDQLDNTLIFFLQDNGGCAEFISGKNTDINALGTDDSFESYRLPWANASNTPFRMFKHWTHEGGIATPLIIYWPAGVADPGRISKHPGQLMDIMATCIDITDADYPQMINGYTIQQPEGKSMVNVILNNPDDSERILYWEHEANRAIRKGDWKLVMQASEKFPFEGKWELYNLAGDRAETNDLAEKYPEKVEEMKKLWQDWAERIKVYPLDNRPWNERLEAPTAISEEYLNNINEVHR